jgi:hypothetical protein
MRTMGLSMGGIWLEPASLVSTVGQFSLDHLRLAQANDRDDYLPTRDYGRRKTGPKPIPTRAGASLADLRAAIQVRGA